MTALLTITLTLTTATALALLGAALAAHIINSTDGP